MQSPLPHGEGYWGHTHDGADDRPAGLAGSAFGPFGFGSIAHGDELPTVVQRPLPDEGDSECDHGGPQDCKTLLLVLLVLGWGWIVNSASAKAATAIRSLGMVFGADGAEPTPLLCGGGGHPLEALRC